MTEIQRFGRLLSKKQKQPSINVLIFHILNKTFRKFTESIQHFQQKTHKAIQTLTKVN